MVNKSIDKPWEHPERSDWNTVLAYMVNEIRAGKNQSEVVEGTAKYVKDNRFIFNRSNISTYYPWLCRKVKEENLA